jgi:hypothetical protein
MNRGVIFSFLAISFFFQSACELEKTISPEGFFPFEGEQPVFYSFLGNDRPVTAFLWYSVKPFTDFVDKRPIEDAVVLLYEDDVPVEQLVFRDSLYASVNDFIPDAGKAYRFRITIPGFSDISSQAIALPDKLEIVNHSVRFNEARTSLSVEIAIQDQAGTANYYAFSSLLCKNNRVLTISRNIRPKDELPFSELNLIADTYFDGEVFTRNFQSNTFLREWTDSGLSKDTLWADEFQIKLSAVSESIHLWDQFLTNYNPEIGGFFPGDQEVYSNMHGAYGFIGSYYLDSLTVKLY